MDYVDRSSLLQGLSKFPGVNIDGCLAAYNKFYDTYLDRARLIYGDTNVTDVTPSSVINTLRSRYIASIDQLYQGRDQFEFTRPRDIDLGCASDGMALYASISPLGPRDLFCIIYGCTGDGINISTTDITTGKCRILSAVLLKDSVWGHTFKGWGSDLEDGVRCDNYLHLVRRTLAWNSGVTEKSSVIYPLVALDTRTKALKCWFVLQERIGDVTTEGYITFTGGEVETVPTFTSMSKRLILFQFDKSMLLNLDFSSGSSITAFGDPPSLKTETRYAYPSMGTDYSPRGNFRLDGHNVTDYCHTTKDFLTIVSAAFLNAVM